MLGLLAGKGSLLFFLFLLDVCAFTALGVLAGEGLAKSIYRCFFLFLLDVCAFAALGVLAGQGWISKLIGFFLLFMMRDYTSA